ncbi:4529_t:CDS:2 [Rhizophagus irregularis]|nr:4529_t:CDS:2 [Rhizophagus irregularis]
MSPSEISPQICSFSLKHSKKLVGVFPGLLVFIGKARLSKVCAHNIEELHLHSGKQGRGGKKQSGTAKRSNDPNDDKLTKEEIESLDYSGDKGDSDNHHQ